MSCSTPTFDSGAHHLTSSLLAAIEEAGSYHPPTAPAHSPPIEDIVFRLLTWPLSSACGETTVVGLPLAMQCFGEYAAEHMQYDERVHRLCLRVGSDVIWRGEQLGLPKTYLDWLCAEGQKGCVNILRVGCEQLLDGLDRWQAVTGRKL